MKVREEGKCMGGEETARAMRILEALSGVDENLLDRTHGSGEAAPLRQTEGKKTAALWRWGRAWAAMLCLALVGAAGWNGYRMMQDKGYNFMMLRDAGGGVNPADGIMTGGVDAAAEAGGLENTQAAMVPVEEDSSGVMQPAAVNGAEKFSTDSAGGIGSASEITNKETDSGTGFETETCLTAPGTEKLTEAQARGWERLGEYVPAALPQGYAFSGAVYNAGSGALTVYWERGMDSILVNVRAADDVAAVDVDDPVFASGDLSLEIVRSRMVSYQDAGDTDTPRGMFGILYPDGILVRFNGRGTAEEIWEMFRALVP